MIIVVDFYYHFKPLIYGKYKKIKVKRHAHECIKNCNLASNLARNEYETRIK